MHLQSVERKYNYKVWLEDKGKRIFEPVDKIPAKVLKALRETVVEKRKCMYRGLIAAAGLSTRLQDLSEKRNKVLLDLGLETEALPEVGGRI